ncbi:MAG: AtpZ/AtpI family protein [Lachnospiraceae bacterium]|jgi:F0F1-type ATP synthase assembly protein I|nr:AtpZ/AtpI family protein [Lachnospiraceae bacterium]MCI6330482.1 AtpZ/AtpI family protein [Lachnospiraceae bacterium]MCI6409781.1 AtpZ/AtpI family protein [Lachnospiraceae bacterium]MCI6977247.1 AtpZ/AtpI family protein [Lachnospiraceae bacterium]MDD6580679.1 AtpZ/AtpI family protein [Lachnospiraceae bacterium]
MKKNKYDKEVYRSLTLITQFGINMLVPIFLCTFLGIFIDKKLGTNFIVIIMFFLGALAGARNIYIFSKSIYDKPKGKRKSD